MDASVFPSRFAAWGSDGRITALVAEGLPAWPEDNDLTALEDADLGTYEAAILEEITALRDDPNGDLDAIETHAAHVEALRTEAARRITEAEAAAAAAAGDDPPAPPAAVDPPAPVADDADRAARLAAIDARLNPPSPELSAEIVQAPTLSAAELAAAVTAGNAPLVEAVTAALSAAAADDGEGRVRITRVRDRAPVRAADLGGYVPEGLRPTGGTQRDRTQIPASLLFTANVPGKQQGSAVTSLAELRAGFIAKHNTLGRSSGVEDEKVTVASMVLDEAQIPAERDIRGMEWEHAREKALAICGPQAVGIDPWTGKEALVASGGLAAPVEPYYPQMVVAQGARPVQAALPTMIAERGGIRLVPPPHLGDLTLALRPGQFADGVTNTDTSFVSATAAFTAADAGKPIVSVAPSVDIPAGTIITTVTNGTTLVLSQATTGTHTGQGFYLPARNPNNLGSAVGIVTSAQDAAGPPNTIKFTFDVPVGSQIEHDVYSVYTSLQFSNLTARTFPEQVDANIKLADAVAARVAETQMLDYISLWSTLFTGAKTFGSARQLFGQWGHMATYYRGHNRMDPNAVLRLGIPFWALALCREDYLNTFIGGGAANWGLSDDEIADWFQDHRIVPFFYQDGPSDISQLFANPPGSATGTGSALGTPTPIPDYPGTGATTSFRTKVVSFMWAEGTWLGLTTGELNLGLVRDSILNSQNRFRNFQEEFETPAFVGVESLRCVHTVASDGTYGAAASITLGVGSGL